MRRSIASIFNINRTITVPGAYNINSINVSGKSINSNAFVSYVNIDSSKRQKNYIAVQEKKIYYLPNNPLHFVPGSSIVTVNIPHHTFCPDDVIVINNIKSSQVILQGVLTVKRKSNYIRILHKCHELKPNLMLEDLLNDNLFQKTDYVEILSEDFDNNQIIIDSVQYYIFKNNASVNLNVHINNFNSNIDTVTDTCVGNIPINFINGTHQIIFLYTKQNGIFISDPDSYLIFLPDPAEINYFDKNKIIILTYDHICGIPIDYFSMSKPFTILETTDNTVLFDIEYVPNIVNNSVAGGNQCYISKITDTLPGYPNNNNYVYKLDRNYFNVIQIRLIGSIFPLPIDNVDNTFYWKNLYDGSHLYSVTLPPNNSSIYYVMVALEKKINSTLINRYMSDEDLNIYDNDGAYKYNLFKIIYTEDTDTTTISSFKKIRQYQTKTNQVVFAPNDHIQIIIDSPNTLFKNHNIILLYSNNISNIENFLFVGPVNNHCLVMTLTLNTHILINFFVKEMSTNEIKSINTETLLSHYSYNNISKQVFLTEHKLSINDLIITDKFIDIGDNTNKLFIYKIVKILDPHNFIVARDVDHQYKFIYDNIIIGVGNNDNYELISTCQTFLPSPVFDDLGIPKICISQNEIIFSDIRRYIFFYHPQHNIKVGDTITVESDIIVNGVTINGDYIVNKIINGNFYQSFIDKYVLHPTKHIRTSGTVIITYPNYSQLLFNFPNTLGRVLKFSDVGKPFAITPFNHIIKNTDPYIETNIVSSASCIYQNLEPMYNYFYIVSQKISFYRNTGPVENVFAKIRWVNTGLNTAQNIIFDSFEPIVCVFDVPLSSLFELDFSFYYPDGRAVSFGNVDHSFTLEIIETFNQPENTNISTRLDSQILTRKIS